MNLIERKEGLKKLKDELINPAEVRKRGRPAKRQRKKETSSIASSKKEVEISQT